MIKRTRKNAASRIDDLERRIDGLEAHVSKLGFRIEQYKSDIGAMVRELDQRVTDLREISAPGSFIRSVGESLQRSVHELSVSLVRKAAANNAVVTKKQKALDRSRKK